jgi:hypothetical protein
VIDAVSRWYGWKKKEYEPEGGGQKKYRIIKQLVMGGRRRSQNYRSLYKYEKLPSTPLGKHKNIYYLSNIGLVSHWFLRSCKVEGKPILGPLATNCK